MKALSAYEFARIESDFTAKGKAMAYDIDVVAYLILKRADVDLRKTVDYRTCKDVFVELTMSCEKDEAKNWMRYWMANAMSYGNQTRNLDWRTKFLAAYDIFNGFFREEKACS